MKVHAMSGDPRQLFRMAPLTALSPASDIQFRYLKELSAEIRTLLKEMWDSPGVINEKGPKVPARFWLWTLGSYELARTLRLRAQMDFPELSARFKEFETFIKPLRIVLAKQEFAGEKNTDAWREVIATNVTENPPDYEYEVRGARFSIAGCLDEFSRVFDSIRYEDVEAVVAKRWQFPTQGPYVKRDSPA